MTKDDVISEAYELLQAWASDPDGASSERFSRQLNTFLDTLREYDEKRYSDAFRTGSGL